MGSSYRDAYLGALGAQEMRGIKGKAARYGLFQRLVRLAREVGEDLDRPGFLGTGTAWPRSLDEFEVVAADWKRRKAKRKAHEALAEAAELGKSALQSYSPGQVGKALGVTAKTVSLWCDQGLLAFERLPSGHRRVSAEALKAFQRQRRAASGVASGQAGSLAEVAQELIAKLEATNRPAARTRVRP